MINAYTLVANEINYLWHVPFTQRSLPRLLQITIFFEITPYILRCELVSRVPWRTFHVKGKNEESIKVSPRRR